MNQLINEQRERIAHLERVNDGLTSVIEKMKWAAKELGYNNSMTCSELDYLIETARAVVMVNQKNLELASQLVAVKESGGTGQSPCAKFCESVALCKDFYQLREHADRLHVENCETKRVNAELLAQVEQLKELASFWIDQSQPRNASKQEYNTWLALGYESSAMRLTAAQLARIKQQGGEA